MLITLRKKNIRNDFKDNARYLGVLDAWCDIQQRNCIDDHIAMFTESIEIGLGEDSRLTHHPVTDLAPH